jgi:MerR family copper efflux transcriptional regulator
LFPIRKLTILRKVKKIKELCTGVLEYVEHIILQIDVEISQKGRFRMETSVKAEGPGGAVAARKPPDIFAGGIAMTGLTIGRLAKEADIGIETVRFYERQGLIAPPPRTASNYRIYQRQEVSRLRFIKRAKALGFTLNEIKELLALSHDPHTTRADIKKRTLAKIEDVDRKIRDLTSIKAALEHLAAECDGQGSLEGCPILAALTSDEETSCGQGQ